MSKDRPDNRLLIIELAFLFGVLPVALYIFRLHIISRVVPLLVAAALVCLCMLWKDRSFRNDRLWRTRNLKGHIRSILLFFALNAVGITLLTCVFARDHLFFFIRTRPLLWFLTLLIYPLLSAYAQEVIFRGFFFHRYRTLFSSVGAMLLINGVTFGLFHVFYGNWISPLLAGAGGILFGYRYLKSGSLVPAAIEHALYGNFLFTIGLGWYFYSGSVV